jgi:hypothetical protein
MVKFSLAIAPSDLAEIDKQAKAENISRSQLVNKAVSYGIVNEITKTVPSNFKPKNVVTLSISCTDKEKQELNNFIKKHRLIKSRWIVGLLLDKDEQDLKILHCAKQLNASLKSKDIEQIKKQFNLLLELDNERVTQKVIEQYFLNKN